MIGNSAKVFADIELREVIYSALQQLKTEYQIILLKYYYQEKLIRGNCIRRGNPRVYSKKQKLKKRQGKAEGNLDKGVRH